MVDNITQGEGTLYLTGNDIEVAWDLNGMAMDSYKYILFFLVSAFSREKIEFDYYTESHFYFKIDAVKIRECGSYDIEWVGSNNDLTNPDVRHVLKNAFVTTNSMKDLSNLTAGKTTLPKHSHSWEDIKEVPIREYLYAGSSSDGGAALDALKLGGRSADSYRLKSDAITVDNVNKLGGIIHDLYALKSDVIDIKTYYSYTADIALNAGNSAKLAERDITYFAKDSDMAEVKRHLEACSGSVIYLGMIYITSFSVTNILLHNRAMEIRGDVKIGYTIEDASGNEWRCNNVTGSTSSWGNWGQNIVTTASNIALGLVKGSEEAGKVQVLSDGTMKINEFKEMSTLKWKIKEVDGELLFVKEGVTIAKLNDTGIVSMKDVTINI